MTFDLTTNVGRRGFVLDATVRLGDNIGPTDSASVTGYADTLLGWLTADLSEPAPGPTPPPSPSGGDRPTLDVLWISDQLVLQLQGLPGGPEALALRSALYAAEAGGNSEEGMATEPSVTSGAVPDANGGDYAPAGEDALPTGGDDPASPAGQGAEG